MKTIVRLLCVALLIQAISGGCKKDTSGTEADILTYSIKNQQTDTEINPDKHTVTVEFPSTTLVAGNMVAIFSLSDGASATVAGIPQVSGTTTNSYNLPFTFLVKSEDKSNTVEWEITGTNNSTSVAYGLGGFETSEDANNKSYEWYIDQFTTGEYSGVNCGPTSTVMAAKWSDPAFTDSPVDARAVYRPEGGWWYTNDIDNYLSGKGIPHYIEGLSFDADATWNTITANIESGNIVILCLDMYYIRDEEDPDFRVDKFYTTSSSGWGHFIVVKGYRVVDTEKFYEVYDPFANDRKYGDGTLKGKNRYYRSTDIYNAASIWWNYGIVVQPAGAVKDGSKGIDPSSIPSAWGR